MAASEVEVVNIALLRIGITSRIDNLLEDRPEAQAASSLFAATRDRLLAEAPWPFAQRRAVLVKPVTTERLGWDFVYALPADCILARAIEVDRRAANALEEIPFQIEGDPVSGRVLLTDVEGTTDDPLRLIYTARIVEPGLWPAHFADALAWLLAADLAMGLTVKEGLAQRAWQGARLAVEKAIAIAAGENTSPPEPESTIVSSRGLVSYGRGRPWGW